jgi:hypothetical protein
MPGTDLYSSEADIQQALVATPEQAGQRHAVNGPGIAGFGVWLSRWASIHSKPTGSPAPRDPLHVPIATE